MPRRCCIVAIALLTAVVALGGEEAFDVKKVVTVDEFLACGLQKLTPEELSKLNALIDRLRREAAAAPAATAPAPTEETGEPPAPEAKSGPKPKCAGCAGKKIIRCDACQSGRATCPECAGTRRAIGPCKPCNALGHAPCNRCRGRGSWPCEACGGSGTITETVEDNSGRRITAKKVCYHCNGTKNLYCPDCERSGRLICPICRGSRRSEQRCAKCEASGRVFCTTCKGDGWKPCPECRPGK